VEAEESLSKLCVKIYTDRKEISNVSEFMKKEAVAYVNKDKYEDGFLGNVWKFIDRTAV
jgi:hypothetical protein